MSHQGRWTDCLAAVRGTSPAMFAYGLVGAAAIAGHAAERPYPVLDLSLVHEEGSKQDLDQQMRRGGFERFLHHMAHCGLGGEA